MKQDTDPQETREWIEALDAVVRACVAAGRAEARGNATAAT